MSEHENRRHWVLLQNEEGSAMISTSGPVSSQVVRVVEAEPVERERGDLVG